jgi:hypothetical protein
MKNSAAALGFATLTPTYAGYSHNGIGHLCGTDDFPPLRNIAIMDLKKLR